MNLIYEYSVFEKEMDNNDTYMIEALGTIYSEKVSGGLGNAVKTFFANVINSIRRFITSIVRAGEDAHREASSRMKLVKLKNQLKKAINEGKTTCEMVDYKRLSDLYSDLYKDVKKQGDRIMDKFITHAFTVHPIKTIGDKAPIAKNFNNYNTIMELEKDYSQLQNIVDEYNDELESIKNRHITVSCTKALEFVEKELSGRGCVIDNMNNAIKYIHEIEDKVSNLIAKSHDLGYVPIEKEMGLIRRFVTWIGKTFVSCAVKFFVYINIFNVL
jgi:hypothetical protein